MKDGRIYRIKRRAKGFIIYFLLSIVAISCLFPLLWMFGSSLKTQATIFSDMSIIPKQAHWENYLIAWTKGGFGVYFLNSLLYTTLVVLGIVVVSSWAAYAFSRLKFPGSNLFFNLFLVAMMIPLPGSFVPLYVLVNNIRKALIVFLENLTPFLSNFLSGDSVAWLISFLEQQLYPRGVYIFCMINVGLSLSIFILKTFFDKMPKELEDAARMDGCTKLGIWRHVALPLARPAIAVIIIFNTLNVWNEYILAQLILSEKSTMPLQRGLMVFQGVYVTQYPLLMAGLTMTAIPILIVYLALQKYIIKGMTQGAVVG